MSDALYAVRLRWDGRRGVAKWRDGLMTLATQPVLGFDYFELDYAPPVCKIIRPHQWEEMRDMTPEESAACSLHLARMAGPPDLEGA